MQCIRLHTRISPSSEPSRLSKLSMLCSFQGKQTQAVIWVSQCLTVLCSYTVSQLRCCKNMLSTASTDDIFHFVVLYRYATATLTVQLSRSKSAEELQHPYGAITSDIRFALNRWFEEWTKLHKLAISRNEWDALGFYKNGDQYAYATLLLLSAKARPHLRHLLWPNADRPRLLQELNK